MTTGEGIAMRGKHAVSPRACATLILGCALGAAPALALAQVAAIQSQDTNLPGIAADLVEAKRSDGVLSIKMRLKNTSASNQQVQFFGYERSIDRFYVQAEG